MTKQLNEANVSLSIQDLNSSDMATLSQILSLAGQAEQPVGGDAMGGPLSMAGPDGNLGSDIGMVDLGTPEVTVGTMDDMVDMGAGEPGVDDPMGMDMPEPAMIGDDGSVDMPSDDMGMDDMGMEDDMLEGFDRIAQLSGIQLAEEADVEEEALDEACGEDHIDETLEEADEVEDLEEGEEQLEEEVSITDDFEWIETAEDAMEPEATEERTQAHGMRESLDAIDAIVEADESSEEDLADDEEKLDENADGMYNFELDEDAVAEMTSPGIGDNRVFGPYPNEQACMIDARKEIPGAMRDREIKLAHKPDGWYWSKLNESVNESVDDLAAQLNEQFAAFMKGE